MICEICFIDKPGHEMCIHEGIQVCKDCFERWQKEQKEHYRNP